MVSLRSHLRYLVVFLVLVSSPVTWAKESQFASDKRALRTALSFLSLVPTGRALIRQVKRRWRLASNEALLGIFRSGAASRTDAVLTRFFDPQTGVERKERQITIYIRRGQRLTDLILDVAHELTHAGAETQWDPYDPNLTASKYVWNAIEGQGGEVDAMVSECRVADELKDDARMDSKRCASYYKPVVKMRFGKDSKREIQRQVDREKVRRDFYAVGGSHKRVVQDLGAEADLFPHLSNADPVLFSSTGNAPYPVALLREFRDITTVACENSRRRLEALPDTRSVSLAMSMSAAGVQKKGARAPASLERSQKVVESTSKFIRLRCGASH